MRIAVPFALILCTLLPSPAAAQSPLSWGVKGGLNITTIDVSAAGFEVSPDSRSGVLAGVFMGYQIHDNFGLQVEGMYNQKGASVNEFGIEADLRVDYIEVPVLARADVRASEEVAFHFAAGPAFAFKQHDTIDIGDFGFGLDTLEIKSYDVGIAVGGGVTFRKLVVDARYTFGLVNVIDDAVGDFLGVKNRAFSLTAGWRFR